MNKLITLIFLILFSSGNLVYSAEPRANSLRVDIIGVAKELEENIRSELNINQAIKEDKLSLLRIENLHGRAPNQILDTLEALGYYHAKVTSTLTDDEQGNWQAHYEVFIEQPTKLNNIMIEVIGPGKDHPELNKQLKNHKLKTDNIVLQKDYEDIKQYLLTTAQHFGFLSAKFTLSQLLVNRDNYTAEIKFVLNTNQQYVFGPITFTETKYADHLLKRFIPFKAGDLYTKDKIDGLQNNLINSDLFNKVRIYPAPNLTAKDDLAVPIKVKFVDKPTNRYYGSIGYGTDTSFRGGLGWQHRRTSVAGHKANTGINISGIRKQVFANYTIPGQNAATDKYVISTSLSKEKIKNKISKKASTALSKITKVDNLETFLTLEYLAENFKLEHNPKLKHRKFLLPATKFIWSNLEKNDAELVHGKKIELGLRAGLGNVLSATNLLQVDTSAKFIFPLATDTRLITFARLGYTATKHFADVPFSLRFFAGGDQSVRGFGYHSLGPKEIDAKGVESVIGGKHLMEFSLELDQRIYDELSGAIFVDAGNSMNKWTTKNMSKGAGIGVRYATPIGSLKLDFAKQISQIQSNKVRIHLTFSTDL